MIKLAFKKVFFWFLILVISLLTFSFTTPSQVIYMPSHTRFRNLSSILSSPTFTAEDYKLITEQTGLYPPAIDSLLATSNGKEAFLDYQKLYFRRLFLSTQSINPISKKDFAQDAFGNPIRCFKLAPFQDGDIFLTSSTHTLGYHHGHAGLVISAKDNLILESLAPGMKSQLLPASDWEFYPTFKLLRLKALSSQAQNDLIDYASHALIDLPYYLLMPKDPPFSSENSLPKATYCSLIVWQALNHIGYDIDSSCGYFVSPKDFALSPYFETVQIFGINPVNSF